MNTIKVPLQKADVDQLRRVAIIHNLDMPDKVDADSLRGLLKQAAYPYDYIEVPAAAAPTPLFDQAKRVMASTLPADLFTRRDLGNCDAQLVYAARMPHEEIKRLKADGAIFIDGLSDDEIAAIKDEQAEKRRLRDLRDNSFVRIVIAADTNSEALKMVATSLNGAAMFVPRGMPIYVRWPYFMLLAGAMEKMFEKDRDDKIVAEHWGASYPMQVLDAPRSMLVGMAA